MENKILLKRNKKIRIGELLIEFGVITQEDLNNALEIQKKTGSKLGEVLVSYNFASEELVLAALSEQFGIEIIELVLDPPNPDVLKQYEKYANLFLSNCCLPYKLDLETRSLYIVTSDPLDNRFFNELSLKFGYNIKLYLEKKQNILNAIQKYYGDYFTRNILDTINIDEDSNNQDTNVDVDIENEDDAPIIKLLNSMFVEAVRSNASDIHIEPLPDRIRIRYRIDGELHEKNSYASSLLSNLITRLKVVGGMKIEEKRKPQDGRYGIRVDGIAYDIRISILPTVHGEKAVMRLTNKERLTMEKKNLGLLPEDEIKFNELLSNPNGIILVTGPTGSGKSTTLYTALSELNKENVNIVTIEDPVEANIEGLNQVAINNDAGMTFPSALRCFLRQDPDIIMVGEIRDKETASLAIDASLTGHLVVSNSSVSAINRLERMGIESYLLADATVGILAQRLVKRLCTCKKQRKISIIDRKKLGLKPDEEVTIYDPNGCPLCDKTGYKGRIAIYEILMFTKDLKDAIADEKPIAYIEEIAIKEGLSKLRDSCIKQIKNGITSIQELDRVVHLNSIDFEEEYYEEQEQLKEKDYINEIRNLYDNSKDIKQSENQKDSSKQKLNQQLMINKPVTKQVHLSQQIQPTQQVQLAQQDKPVKSQQQPLIIQQMQQNQVKTVQPAQQIQQIQKVQYNQFQQQNKGVVQGSSLLNMQNDF